MRHNSASRKTRHTAGRPCGVCGGHDGLPRGQGKRCSGWTTADGYAHCSREEHARGLPQEGGGTYAHRLNGACRCGVFHSGAGAATDSPARRTSSGVRTPPKITRYEIRDAEGKVVAVHVRRDLEGGKRITWEQPNGHRGLRGQPVANLPLYRLPEMLSAPNGETVIVVEGEKATDALHRAGLVAVGTVTGATGTPSDSSLRPLVGRDVVLWPDHDEVGRDHMRRIGAALVRLGGKPRLLNWPEARDPGDDAADFLARGGTAPDVRLLIADAQPVSAEAEPTDAAVERRPSRSQSSELVDLVHQRDAELWHHRGEAFATVLADAGHREHWPLRSAPLRDLLARTYFDASGRVPSSQALTDALNVLVCQARYRGPEHETAVRVAQHGDRIYLDLCDAAWRVVDISNNRWRVIENSPVRFTRRNGMQALPEPVRGGSLDDLRKITNVPEDDDWRLVVAWVVATLFRGPYCILALQGEQGSAKSTFAKMLRSVVDPHDVPLRRPPRDERDLMIAATNNLLVGYDNLSGLRTDLADALCSLATGAGFGTRRLFSDGDEHLCAAMRPMLINGIDDICVRGDLADRAVILTLPPIPDTKRRAESELWEQYHAIRPAVLGALLDIASGVLRERPEVKLTRMPRMADFARIGAAVERVLGWGEGAFLAAYDRNRTGGAVAVIEGSVVGAALLGWLEGRDSWSGTPADLLRELNAVASEEERATRGWPDSARGMTAAVIRLAPALRGHGVGVERVRKGHKSSRVTRFYRLGGELAESGRQPSASSAPAASSASARGPAPDPTPRRADGGADGGASASATPSADRRQGRERGGAKRCGVPASADDADGADGRPRVSSRPSPPAPVVGPGDRSRDKNVVEAGGLTWEWEGEL